MYFDKNEMRTDIPCSLLHIAATIFPRAVVRDSVEVLPRFLPLLFSFSTAAVDPFDSYIFTGTCLSGLTLVSDSVTP